MPYNPALDGLRAVAIIMVLGCHTASFALPGGWLGVDVFFTLSGYLITSILLRELRSTGSVDLAGFYSRRALRLLPALGLLVAFQVVRSWFSSNGQEIREATLVGALYLENWNNVFHWWPFDLMGHTWSLAVEEQFYMLWPLLLPLVIVRRPMIWIFLAAAAMIIARVACWRAGYAETTLDYSLLLRPVGLLVGCALAFRGPYINSLVINGFSWLGATKRGQGAPSLWANSALALIAVVVATVGHSVMLFALAPAVVSLATAVVVLGSAGWLSVAPLRYLGRVSYGVYLYHWPLFQLGEQFKPAGGGHLYAVGLIGVILAVASLSYEFIEKPCLRLKDRIGAGQVMPVAVAAE